MYIVWGLSSAGRASALQAEGHRFEPYRPHFLYLHYYYMCRSGGTGRRPGLKIPWVEIPVPVRSRSTAERKTLDFQGFFHVRNFLYTSRTSRNHLHIRSKPILTADFQPFPILFYPIEMDYVEQGVEFTQSKQK